MDVNQDDIDKLLQGALEGDGDAAAPAAPSAPEPDISGAASQDDIDALFAAAGDDPAPAAPPAAPIAVPSPPPPPPEPEINLDGVASQDDIDALFSAVGGGDAAPEPPAAAPAPEPVAEPELDLSGVADQNDIDALFSAVGGGDAAPEPPAAAPAPEPAAEPELDLSGVADQNDIDALFSAVGGGDAAPETPAPAPAAEPELDLSGAADQNDIDALFSAVGGAAAEPEAPPEPEPEPEPEISAAEDAAAEDDGDLDALLSSIADGVETDENAVAEGESDTTIMGDIDMEELLRQVSDAAPPPPPPPPPQPVFDAAETTILSPDISEALVQNELSNLRTPPPAPPPAPAPVPPAPAAPLPAAPSAADVMAAFPGGAPSAPSAPRREFSVLYGAGDVESVANQINALLNAMSEKAHGYMQSWIAADSEAKELRSRALEEERRRTSLESEKLALSRQIDDLRSRLGELEGGKVATEEAKRTLETSFQAKVRELESRVSMLSAEAETLKDELTRARNQATGVDIESRRVRFELDRLKNEVESERMERLRIQRALENREKEIQAMQAQASGQASSLFIDELHRLVRRLESELDARSSGAHEALRQLDRIEVSEDMVPVAANLRAALMQALGQDADQDDALKSLGREAAGVRGVAAIAPQKAEIVSFESAIATYNLVGAVDIASALLREASASPSVLMRKIYQCPALRRPEVADHLGDLARLLEGLRTVQESNDRSRGVESGDSEVFYVYLFDFMHNLVRLKLINRMSGDIWRVFLDLRGRFSFVTSDKQWAEYRDNTLRDRNVKS